MRTRSPSLTARSCSVFDSAWFDAAHYSMSTSASVRTAWCIFFSLETSGKPQPLARYGFLLPMKDSGNLIETQFLSGNSEFLLAPVTVARELPGLKCLRASSIALSSLSSLGHIGSIGKFTAQAASSSTPGAISSISAMRCFLFAFPFGRVSDWETGRKQGADEVFLDTYHKEGR